MARNGITFRLTESGETLTRLETIQQLRAAHKAGDPLPDELKDAPPAVCEAFTGDDDAAFDEAMTLWDQEMLVAAAFRAKYADPDGYGVGYGDLQVFPDAVVAKQGGKSYRATYRMENGEAIFDGDLERVEVEFRPVQEAAGAPEPFAESFTVRLGEASDDTGWVWDVAIIEAGQTKQHMTPSGKAYVRDYPREVLDAARPLFEGAHVFAFSGQEHAPTPGAKGVLDQVGWLESVEMVGDEMRAQLHILRDKDWLRVRLQGLDEASRLEQMGLSIDAAGEGEWLTKINESDPNVYRVNVINSVSSVEVVHSPAAGGGFVRLVASTTSTEVSEMGLEAILALLEANRPDLLEGKDKATITLAEAEELLAEATKPAPATEPDPAPAPAPAPAQESLTEAGAAQLQESFAEMQKTMQLIECRGTLNTMLAEADLQDPAKAKLRKQFEGRVFEASELTEAITAEAEMIADVIKNLPRSYGAAVEVTDDERDKLANCVEAMFWDGPNDATHPNFPEHLKGVVPFRSLTEAFRSFTGERGAQTGRIMQSTQGGLPPISVADDLEAIEAWRESKRLSESATTATWAEVFASRLAKRMQAEYMYPQLQDWRKIVSAITNVPNFQTQRRIKVGGYTTLSTVAEQATYPNLTSPTDTEETYAVAKYGGLEDITFEMVKNDDLGAVRQIPAKLGRAAGQTLYRQVFDVIEDNDALTDTYALVSSDHSNILASALSNANLSLAHEYMANQAAYGNTSEILMLEPKTLLVPNELAETAFQLTSGWPLGQGEHDTGNRNTNFHASYGLTPLKVGYFAVATDYWVCANPVTCPTIEVGFLDGRQDPELFTQDQPNVGSNFTADKISFKIRHIFGTSALDYRWIVGYIA